MNITPKDEGRKESGPPKKVGPFSKGEDLTATHEADRKAGDGVRDIRAVERRPRGENQDMMHEKEERS